MQYLYNCDQRRRKGKTLKREEGGNKKWKKKKKMKNYRITGYYVFNSGVWIQIYT